MGAWVQGCKGAWVRGCMGTWVHGCKAGVPLLMQLARTHRSVEVRKQAMFWLGQSRDPRAVSFFEELTCPEIGRKP